MRKKAEIKFNNKYVEFNPNEDVITSSDLPYGKILLIKENAPKLIVLDNVRAGMLSWKTLLFYIRYGGKPMFRIRSFGREYIHATVENIAEIKQFYKEHRDENRKVL